jgi:hypothetical protein
MAPLGKGACADDGDPGRAAIDVAVVTYDRDAHVAALGFL